jgi:hypothetical protein
VRGRIIDLILVIAAIIGVIWLALLIYHNHLGGHVERSPAVTEDTAIPGRR